MTTAEISMIQEGIEDRMAESFPLFCRRVCGFCNGNVRDILPGCPVVKFDSFLHLMKTYTFAEVAGLLNDEVKRTVDEDLIHLVKIQASITGNIHRKNRSNDQ